MSREIKRSKTLRMWHKYKNVVYLIAAVLLVVVIAIVSISKVVGDKKEKESESQSQSQSISESQSAYVQASEQASEQASIEAMTTEAPTLPPVSEPVVTEAPTVAGQIVKTPQKEDFQYESSFDNAVFVGDVFVSGMDVYQHLDSSKLVYNEQWTTGKASNNVDKIAATKASKIYILLGLNDLNNGKKASSVFESYKELVNDIKDKMPGATIYVISTFPVSTGFEAKEGTTVKNSEIKALNELLATMEGVKFLDVAASISLSDGSLNTDLSASGYNIVNSYYGFILNLIAEMSQ